METVIEKLMNYCRGFLTAKNEVEVKRKDSVIMFNLWEELT